MIEGHIFVDAYFTNDERTAVTSLWKDNKGTIRPFNITANENNPHWKELMEYTNIDLLHERTFKQQNAWVASAKEAAIVIAKEQGWVYDLDNIDSDVYKAVAAVIMRPFDPVADKESLFLYKLSLFESDAIKNSDDKSLKTKLRKSASIIEATKYAIQILEKN